MELKKETTYQDLLDNWQDYEWEDSFTITGISRGRSAAHFDAKSEKSRKYVTVFMIDLFDMIKNGDLQNDKISGTFIIKKRGQSFGLRLKHTPVFKE